MKKEFNSIQFQFQISLFGIKGGLNRIGGIFPVDAQRAIRHVKFSRTRFANSCALCPVKEANSKAIREDLYETVNYPRRMATKHFRDNHFNSNHAIHQLLSVAKGSNPACARMDFPLEKFCMLLQHAFVSRFLLVTHEFRYGFDLTLAVPDEQNENSSKPKRVPKKRPLSATVVAPGPGTDNLNEPGPSHSNDGSPMVQCGKIVGQIRCCISIALPTKKNHRKKWR